MAAKYLLYVYFFVRLLLFHGKKEAEKWCINFWLRDSGITCNRNCNAGEYGTLWSTDLYWFLYFAYCICGKHFPKTAGCTKCSGKHATVFIHQAD